MRKTAHVANSRACEFSFPVWNPASFSCGTHGLTCPTSLWRVTFKACSRTPPQIVRSTNCSSKLSGRPLLRLEKPIPIKKDSTILKLLMKTYRLTFIWASVLWFIIRAVWDFAKTVAVCSSDRYTTWLRNNFSFLVSFTDNYSFWEHFQFATDYFKWLFSKTVKKVLCSISND